MATWNISVLTSASSDTEPSLLVNFGTAKYIFNASEGLGRSWLQSHHSFRKMKGLFLTGAGTHRCGGIAGMCAIFCSSARHRKGLFAFAYLQSYIIDVSCTVAIGANIMSEQDS